MYLLGSLVVGPQRIKSKLIKKTQTAATRNQLQHSCCFIKSCAVNSSLWSFLVFPPWAEHTNFFLFINKISTPLLLKHCLKILTVKYLVYECLIFPQNSDMTHISLVSYILSPIPFTLHKLHNLKHGNGFSEKCSLKLIFTSQTFT